MICKDHLGKEFPSVTDMCLYYKISLSDYYRRIKQGWSLEDTLTTPRTPTPPKKPTYDDPHTDHLGQKFESMWAMCKHWHIHPRFFINRIKKQGLSLSDALTLPVTKERDNAHIDPLGNAFPTRHEMCSYWGIGINTFRCRQKSGWSYAAILGTPLPDKRYPIGFSVGDMVIEAYEFDRTDNFYYICVGHNGRKYRWTHHDLQRLREANGEITRSDHYKLGRTTEVF